MLLMLCFLPRSINIQGKPGCVARSIYDGEVSAVFGYGGMWNVLKVGLLDEDFFMYGEDIDLSYRILKGGYARFVLMGILKEIG